MPRNPGGKKMLTSEPLSVEPTPMRSRLSPAQEAAILETALKLVAEVGYDLTSIDEIARRAHASKATIYRRWKGKADIVFAALQQRTTRPHEESFGASLRDDFISGLSGFCARITAGKDLIIGLVPALHANPELWRVMREQFQKREQERAIQVLERAVARGEIPAVPEDPAKLVDIAVALTTHRLVLLRAPLDAAFVTYVVDEVLLPLVDAQITRSSRSAAAAAPSAPPESRPAGRKRRPG
ncbi:TetR/AcrR family transcriptional regulator [Polyangium aurulentum]|uniref:TetR/AcrR family transcriptional regulator n=1 Tax=Polyangium aurulentum TaxID=2567896 RepID=UPI0010AE2C04|nr:TetR/AcrR family transcriptional regulator [Polyangium aurulentum]UQA58540.1 TetR/AcrR family transcriptional regulator [Polyangium aurulentum]